jgi:hypothetical protein
MNKLLFSYGRSSGLIENFIAGVFFNVPTIFFYIFDSPPYAYILYLYVITFLMLSTISHLKYSEK